MSWGTKFPRLHQRRLRSACASSVPSDQRFCCAFYGLLSTKHVNQFVSKFYSSTVSANNVHLIQSTKAHCDMASVVSRCSHLLIQSNNIINI